MAQQFKCALLSPFVSQTLAPVNDKSNQDLDFLRELIEAGRVKPVIDRTYVLNEAADAMRYLEAGHVRRVNRAQRVEWSPEECQKTASELDHAKHDRENAPCAPQFPFRWRWH